MARAHFVRPVTDDTGVPVRSVTVSVYRPQTSQLISQPLYADASTSTLLSNPFQISDGLVEFYLDTPQSISLGLSTGTTTYTVSNLDVFPPVEQIVTSPNGLTISNSPASGQFLQATSATAAAWTDSTDILSTKATALQILANYDPSGQSTTLRVTDVNGNAVVPTYVAAPSGLPDNQTFTYAMRVPTTNPVTFSTEVLTLPETGYVVYCYQTVATDANTAATLQVTMDYGKPSVWTPSAPDLINNWIIGYYGDVPAGSHVFHLTHTPGPDSSSYVLLGSVRVFYGNNIPFHTHQGAAEASTVLGPNAVAPFQGDTVIGGNAVATDVFGTALGSSATAENQGTAVGAYAYAGTRSTAVGYYATTQSGRQNSVAVGYAAQTQSDTAIAMGSNATASGVGSVAVGTGAETGGDRAIALGIGAQAMAPNSAALGPGATVDGSHTGSYAIGPNAATTAPNQLMLGTAGQATTVPGTLTVFGSASIGSSGSTIGFYGASGTPKPTVTGSRGGNATLAQLLTSLAAMGLITDSTTT